jgi:hypothetical protein
LALFKINNLEEEADGNSKFGIFNPEKILKFGLSDSDTVPEMELLIP